MNDDYNEIEPMETLETEDPYDGGGWAGDGSGTDDFEDFNANESSDYGPEVDDDFQYADPDDAYESGDYDAF